MRFKRKGSCSMTKAQIAATHPGKMGDCLYTLPVLRYIYEATGQPIDFYTGEYCMPLKRLFEYQSCINSFQLSKDYIVDNWGCGGQPWFIPVPEGYKKVYQLGFRYTPDRPLHQFIAHQIGIDVNLEIKYEYPVFDSLFADQDYICIAPRGNTTFKEIFNELAKRRDNLIIGGEGDYTGYGFDATGLDMLDTLSILSEAKGFVGLMSSQLVLANGFNIPKIGLNGMFSDMRHAIKSPLNYYPKDPNNIHIEDILTILDKS